MPKIQQLWSTDDIDILKEMYLEFSAIDIALALDRNVASVTNKIQHLKLDGRSKIINTGIVLDRLGVSYPDLEVISQYINNRTRLKVRSKTCGHEWEVIPANLLSRGDRKKCTLCANTST